MEKNSVTLVIVGRPNVGKSTLFNRLLGRRRSLVHNEPGVTRDRIEGGSRWIRAKKALDVKLIDTGGLGGERFGDEIQKQVGIAIGEASAVILVLDGQAGCIPADEELVRNFKVSGIFSKLPVLAVVNKVDADCHEDRLAEFHALGVDDLMTISAEHGRGMDDLEEKIFSLFPKKLVVVEKSSSDDARVHRIPRIAVVGRPNVGKSTLVNAILGEERAITSPVPGTTVDSVDSLIRLGDQDYILVDTAGIRRKSKTEKGVEVLSVVQTKKALESADVALLVLDAGEGVSDQDEKIGGLIEESGCGVVLILNKWDLRQKEKNGFTREMAAERIRKTMPFLRYAPIVFTSAIHGSGLEKLGDLLEEVLRQRKRKVSTHEFTEWVRSESGIHNPWGAKFYLCHQSGRNPPTFVCHVNDSKKVHFSLKRHLINALRERWGFMGNPVRMHFIESRSTK